MFPSSREQIQIDSNQTETKWIVAIRVVSRCGTLGGEIGNLGIWNKDPISQYWRDYFKILVIFSDFINIFQRPLVFSSSREWRFGTLRYSKVHVPFLNLTGIILLF